jgi:hypothetical protein
MLFETQVAPEFVEVKIQLAEPPATATILLPSDEQATPSQAADGALLSDHDAPESLER